MLFSLILISVQKSLLDDVSDGEGEEEEEGQRGLGDFGFGSMFELREMNEEKDPLKLRRGDLDHIVDDVTSDEEEEEGELALGDFFGLTNAAMEIEIALDKQRRKELFAALEKEKEEKRRKLRSRRRSGNNC